MKILFLSTRAPYPPDTGHFQRTLNTLKQLSRFSEIYFVGFYDKGLSSTERQAVSAHIQQFCARIFIQTLPAEDSKISLAWLLVSSVFSNTPFIVSKFYLHNVQKIVRDLIDNDIDLVHVDMLPLVEYLTDVKGVKAILTNHNVESLRLRRRADTERNPLKRMYINLQANKLRNYEKYALGEIKYCIAVSDEDKQLLSELNPDCRYFVVPNGVDSKFYKPDKISGKGNRLLWIGNLADPYNRPGVQYFATQVFPQLLERHPDIQWIVVGKNPPNEVLHLVEKYPHNVRVKGYVKDVRDYYNQADILVVPLLSGSGTKLKVIEGMSMAMPIVTTSIGAEGIEVENKRDILIADDAASFINATETLINDANLRSTLSDNARRIARSTYDWEIMGKKWRQIMTSMVDEQQCAE